MTLYELASPTPAFVTNITERLLSGNVGILPTETVYGLMCRSDNIPGHRRIYRMKRRESRKPLQVLLHSLEDLEKCDIPLSAPLELLADYYWPGPLTMVVPTTTGDEIGIRVPDHPFVLSILKNLPTPLTSTSANLAGEDPIQAAATGFSRLRESPDFWVKAAAPLGGIASTVIRIVGDNVELLRDGAVPFHEITRKFATTD